MDPAHVQEQETFFGRSRVFLAIVLLSLFIFGAGIRLYDLTDPPLDFHPTRQLRSAIIARGLYYRNLASAPEWQQQRAEEQLAAHGLIEPPIFESIVALTYRVIGSDPLWVARIYAILFWLIGGLALFALARVMTSVDGAVIAQAYYLFLPFGIIASRSFQPDPLMVMLILLALWAICRWYQIRTWRWAILAGVLAGAALFSKAVALFFVLFALGGLILLQIGLRKAIKDPQVWVLGILAVLPVVAYHLYGIFVLKTLQSQFEGRFFPEMWVDPAFYVRWMQAASNAAGYGAILAALVGVFLFSTAGKRAFAGGLWIGYAAYGMTFPFHITTHSYYQLPLVAIIALTLAPLGSLVFGKIATLTPVLLVQAAIFLLLFFGIFFKAWDVRVELARTNYRNEPAYWQEIGDILGHDSSVVALTHDYGNRLAYYGWISPDIWLTSRHLENYRELRGGKPIDVQNWFAELTGNKDFFLVTLMNQLNEQPDLKEILYNNYTIYAKGDGYIIFDLRHPIQ